MYKGLNVNYYTCNYADYETLPSVLFTGATSGAERKSLDSTKFIVWSIEAIATGSLNWMLGTEQSYTHSEILTELNSTEWTEAE